MRWLWSAKPVAAATSDSAMPSAIMLLRPGEAAADLEAMRRGAEGGAEMAGQGEAVEAAHRLELLRGDGARRLGDQEVAGAADARDGRSAAPRFRRRVAARRQPVGQARDDGIDGERFERLREVGERFLQQAGEGGIVGHHVGHERRGAAQRRADRGRIDIEHAVGEAVVDAGVAVMRLVGMDHHDLPGACWSASRRDSGTTARPTRSGRRHRSRGDAGRRHARRSARPGAAGCLSVWSKSMWS